MSQGGQGPGRSDMGDVAPGAGGRSTGGLSRAACFEFREWRAGSVRKEQAQGSVRPADTCGSVQIIFG